MTETREGAAAGHRAVAWWERSRGGLIASLVLVALLGLGYFHALGEGDLKDWDEALYATRALAIHLHGGATWLDQVDYAWVGYYSGAFPPLLVWSSAIAFKVFGVTEFAHRFFTCLVGASGLFAMFLLGCALRGRRCGLLGAMLTACVLFYTQYVRRGQFDILYIVFDVWAYACYVWAQGHARTDAAGAIARRRWLLACGVALGLSMMSKILIGGIIFVGVIAPFAAWRAATGRTTWRDVAADVGWVFVAAFAVWAPWHVAMLFAAQPGFWDWYVGFHILQRGATALDVHHHPPYYYVDLLHLYIPPPLLMLALIGVGQGAWFGIAALARGRRGAGGCGHTPADARLDTAASYVLAAWAFLLPFALYTLAGTKRDTYTLALIPPLCLAAALILADVIDGRCFRWGRPAIVWAVLTATIYARMASKRHNVEAFLALWPDELFTRWGAESLWRFFVRTFLPAAAGGAAATALLWWGSRAIGRAAPDLAWRRTAAAAVLAATLLIAGKEGLLEEFDVARGRRHFGWQELRPIAHSLAYDRILFFSSYSDPAQCFYLYGAAKYPMGVTTCVTTLDFDTMRRLVAEGGNPLVIFDLGHRRDWPRPALSELVTSLEPLRSAGTLACFAIPDSPLAAWWRDNAARFLRPHDQDLDRPRGDDER